jgi:molybdopterin converting factor subunit 1
MKKVRILFFAYLKEAANTNRIEIEIDDSTDISGLRQLVAELYPELAARMTNIIVTINQQFAFDSDEIPDEAEIAMFPPVSGGSDGRTIISITRDPLYLDELIERITYTTTGAACLFTGVVRGETSRGDFHQTVALEYEAYIPMAEEKMKQVAIEIRQQWPLVEGIAIVQRIGNLQPRTPTVLIACTAAHRDTGVFEAARYGIDRLKEIVPIWKKEIGADGEIWVEGDYIPKKGD